jgi:carbamoyl-phosphate synthase large subunit
MKSVGEVMAIGRTFAEVIQKAVRMLDIGVRGLDPDAFRFEDIREQLRNPTPLRIFAVAQAIRDGISIDEIHHLTRIDRWFLRAIEPIVDSYKRLGQSTLPLARHMLSDLKRLGFADAAIGKQVGVPEERIRAERKAHGIEPHFSQIDTMAGEFPAETNYLYKTYHAEASDIGASPRKKILMLGSGTYRIGSSVEFDWCAVNAAQAAAAIGYETVMLNHNPETVSTDYDICDRLYFDELNLETVLDLCEHERPDGVVVSMGGQVPNNLAMRLAAAGINILGTSAERIDAAENRDRFSSLLDELGIDQPRWAQVTDIADADRIVEQLGGFPVLVRPSYVLSGAAMAVAREPGELRRFLVQASVVSPEHPVVVTKFETHAREVEIDGVADHGRLVLWAICEHIEDAGTHSGDAALVLPPQTLYIATIRRVKEIAATLARALSITGPFNIQFLARHNVVKVIECNLRASRSFPFVSKVIGENFAAEAMRRMLGVGRNIVNPNLLDFGYVAVKAPMFSFSRVAGADPILGVEMMSTGEVGCLGRDLHEALEHALLATGTRLPRKGVLLSLGPVGDKYWFVEEARVIVQELGLPVYATQGTAEVLAGEGISCTAVEKTPDGGTSGIDVIARGLVDLVINVTREYDQYGRPDGYWIRRQATDLGVPLITDLQLARAVIEASRGRKSSGLDVVALNDYVTHEPDRRLVYRASDAQR